MPRVGVVLAGCGFMDGAEIYESTLTMLSLDRRGIEYQCLAPDIQQMHVVNHRTGEVSTESRNVLSEAARIARGKIEPLSDSWIERLEGFILPGGFGAAKNYCDFAVNGEECSINPILESFLRKVVTAKKPLGVICISPVVLARALKGTNMSPRLTVGGNSAASRAVDNFGSVHTNCAVTDCIVDKSYNIVSTPAFMYNARISEVEQGIDKMIEEFSRLLGK